MENIASCAGNGISDTEDIDENSQPSGRRWDPLGAAKNDDEDGDTTLAQYDTDS